MKSPAKPLCRWIEFFEGANRLLSMGRGLCFLAFFPATWVLITNPTDANMGWYLGAFVLNSIGGKGMDAVAAFATKGKKPMAGTE